MSLNIRNYEVIPISNGHNAYLHHETFSAVLFIDALPTTRTCRHSHRTLRSAAKCVKSQTILWERIVEAHSEVTEIEPNLFHVTGTTNSGGVQRAFMARYKMIGAM
jgi:hypothetical protein